MMKHFTIYSFAFILFLSFSSMVSAGNINIINFGPSSVDTTARTVEFRTDFRFSKTWRNDFNHDAIWVFMKYWDNNNHVWRHAKMSASGLNPAGFSVPSKYEILVPEDKTGFFLRLGPGFSATTSQNCDTAESGVTGGVHFTWDYGKEKDTFAYNLTTAGNTFRLYAIEMVYIPEGSFVAGDATTTGTAVNGFRYGLASTANPPTFVQAKGWPIDSEESFYTSYVGAGIGPGTGPFYYYTSSGGGFESATGAAFIVPSEFPKGYKAFYLMKDEISQGQYRDFLNTLAPSEYSFRCAGAGTPATTGRYCDSIGSGAGSSARQGVRYISSTAAAAAGTAFACAMSSANGFNGSDDGEGVAMNFLSWMDLAAYLDWAGLRPMTELEFEKAGRGPVASVLGEYPWGTTGAPSANTTYSYLNSATEVGDRGPVEYIACAGSWPIRVGSFAPSSYSPVARSTAGAGYYGNLDLAGNVWEMTVTVGDSAGRNFQGSHGDGYLSMDARGAAENNDWPGWAVGVGVDGLGSGGVGMRGGSWNTTLAPLQLSDRSAAGSSATVSTRSAEVGGRGARTAPTFAAPTKPQ